MRGVRWVLECVVTWNARCAERWPSYGRFGCRVDLSELFMVEWTTGASCAIIKRGGPIGLAAAAPSAECPVNHSSTLVNLWKNL